jgi:tRNA dimethylallyltransferase
MESMPAELRPILIAGPTASGKSALALSLAEALGGRVINADSMQVYRELRVLTARPSVDDEARAPHALYGFVPVREAYSAGRFVKDAAGAIADALGAGRRPILVGGTGLYFKALTEGLSPIPEVDSAVRAHWRDEAERRSAPELHAVLAARDSAMAARLMPSDTQRIVRALEVLESTGRSLAAWQAMKGTPVIAAEACHRFVVHVDRAALHARADGRFRRMIEDGGIAEAARLADMQLDAGLPAMRAIGVRPLLALARGEITPDEACLRGQAETRQYIKRQQTWLSRNMISWQHVETKETEYQAREILTFIRGGVDGHTERP